jgi:hypothetical protein
VSSVLDGWDDEQLQDALREALKASQAVPPVLVEMAKNAYAFYNIDAELAQLTYDSSRDRDMTASVRSETAPIRALSFTSPQLSIELEVTEHSLIGQIMPTGEGTIEAQTREGVTTAASIDEIGCFCLEPIPPSPFRLRCRPASGADVVTGWITL